MKAQQNKATAEAAAKSTRLRLSQADVPSVSLANALRVPQAILDNYAGGPVNAVQLAQALNMTPTSGPFRTLCGAAIAYGLTSGGYAAGQIGVEALSKRILRPTEENDDVAAKREAFLRPRVICDFLTKYDGHALPSSTIAQNVLVTLGVPENKASDVLSLIVEGSDSLGLIATIKDKKFIQLNGNGLRAATTTQPPVGNQDTANDCDEQDILPTKSTAQSDVLIKCTEVRQNNKVFVTHGKNKSFVEPIKELLKFGKLEAIVSVERQTASKAVPDKVMDDMRACSAAIIHVDAETQLTDQDGVQHTLLNPNVLIEIGAAMALYGKRFILLVRDGISLPSNLQGLYQVRYQGETLNATETIALLQAINSMSA